MALRLRLNALCDFGDRATDVLLDMDRDGTGGPHLFAARHPVWHLDVPAGASADLAGWRLPDGEDNRVLCPAHNPGPAR